MWTVGKS
ncbi:P2 phage tail completion protein R (GpR), partial [Haemophilus influenzae]